MPKILIKIWRGFDWCRGAFNSITNNPRVSIFGTLVIFLVALFIINKELKNYRLEDVTAAIHDLSFIKIFAAMLCAFGAYIALSFNDRFCLSMLHLQLSFNRTFRGSLATYALAKTLGYSWAVASTARARFYKKWGLNRQEIGALSMTTGTGVHVGSLTCAAVGLLIGANEIANHGPIKTYFWWFLSALLFIPAGVWLYTCASDRASVKWGSQPIFFPDFKGGLSHLLILMLDKIGAAACLYFLLPNFGGWDFPAFLAVFVLAGILGALSGAPAGLGVFEATILTMAPNSQNTPGAALALLFYRLFYNIIPLIAATIILALHHLSYMAQPAANMVKKIGNRAIDSAPQILSILVFLSGYILIASSATPAFSTRFLKVEAYFGGYFTEIFHALAAVIGMILMIIANFLWRESKVALWLAIIVSVLGIMNAMFKGLSYEVAIVLFMTTILLLLSSGEFVQKYGRGGFSLSYGFTAAIIGSLATLAWFSLFAFPDSGLNIQTLLKTGVNADDARSYRAVIAAVITFAIGILVLWLLGGEREEIESNFEELQ